MIVGEEYVRWQLDEKAFSSMIKSLRRKPRTLYTHTVWHRVRPNGVPLTVCGEPIMQHHGTMITHTRPVENLCRTWNCFGGSHKK